MSIWRSTRRRLRQLARRVPVADRWILRHRPGAKIADFRQQLAARVAPPSPRTISVGEGVLPFLTWRPPGHYYSPVPDLNEVLSQADRTFERPDTLAGVELNEAAQLALFEAVRPLAREADFAQCQRPDRRYYTNNPSYGRGDACIMQAFLRHLRPARYLEVGSGWTTALALDTNDAYLDRRMQVTCVEPYPDDLLRLLRPGDPVEVIASPVQEVPLQRFAELEPGDLLFIDCSHVVRPGSDALHLVTRVLPVLRAGVYVHFHDVFWAFQYPRPWIEEGRAWSEAYLLHAFLLFNRAFEVVLFNDWLMLKHPDLLASVPGLAAGAGGGLWLRRAV